MNNSGMVRDLNGELESERTCWICLATESENRRAVWLHPCQCRGSTKWVHESCLHRWIDEKQNGNSRMKVTCMQCRFEYLIVFPQMSRVSILFERFQDGVRRCSPFVASCASLFSIYWTAVTFGGVTVIQVLGHQRGFQLMERGDAVFFLVGLPSIPVALILSRFFRWEDAVLHAWRNRQSLVRRMPLIKRFFTGSHYIPHYNDEGDYQVPDDSANSTRMFCGAMLLPTIATITGKLLFGNVSSPLHRTLLGGLTYIGVKGILKIYLRQRQYVEKRRRYIVDYTEENVRLYANAAQENERQRRQYGGYDPDDDDSDDSTFSIVSNDSYESDNSNAVDELDEVDEAMSIAMNMMTTNETNVANHSRSFMVVRMPDRPYTLF